MSPPSCIRYAATASPKGRGIAYGRDKRNLTKLGGGEIAGRNTPGEVWVL